MICYEMVKEEDKGRRENQGNFGDGQDIKVIKVIMGGGKGLSVLKKLIVGISLLVSICTWPCPVPHGHSLSYSIPFYILLGRKM